MVDATEHTRKQKSRKKKKDRSPQEKKKRRRKRRIIFFGIVAVLVIFRLFLPTIVLHYLNNQLAGLTEYYGHIEDIDIHLYRGAYVINDVKILRKQKGTGGKSDTIPFFRADQVDLSLQWSELFHGAVVGKVALEKPVLNFVKNAHKHENLHADTTELKKLIDGLLPITINKLDIHKGEIHVIDPYATPRFDILMKNVEATAVNITNVRNPKDSLPASLKVRADTYNGKFSLDTRFNADAVKPTFDLNVKLENLNLKALNPFFKAYGNFDVERGNFNLYAEFAAKNGRFGGYVKPIMDHVKVASWKKDEGNIAQITYETFIGLLLTVFKNQREQQVATLIPFTGSVDNPEAGFLSAVINALKNAFVLRYRHELDNSVDIDHMEPEGPLKKFSDLFRKKKS